MRTYLQTRIGAFLCFLKQPLIPLAYLVREWSGDAHQAIPAKQDLVNITHSKCSRAADSLQQQDCTIRQLTQDIGFRWWWADPETAWRDSRPGIARSRHHLYGVRPSTAVITSSASGTYTSRSQEYWWVCPRREKPQKV
jgi:hypothetical protein